MPPRTSSSGAPASTTCPPSITNHHHHHVGPGTDGVDAMGHRNHRALVKLVPQNPLHSGVHLLVEAVVVSSEQHTAPRNRQLCRCPWNSDAVTDTAQHRLDAAVRRAGLRGPC
ncbi:hypothetical protein NHJ13734_008906 [Beauveria thailandica]